MDSLITYKVNVIPAAKAIVDLYKHAGLGKQAMDIYRIKTVFENSNLVVSAWDRFKLAGIARSVTDFSFCCYLSDLAVHHEYSQLEIGKKLIEFTREKISKRASIVLLAAPPFLDYYPRIGFEKIETGFIAMRNA